MTDMADEQAKMDIRMTADDLYMEEIFTDRRVGTLQRLTPVTPQGEPDGSRTIRFVGQTQILTPAGPLPLSFDIDAETLDEAVARFGKAAEAAVEDTMKRLEEMRREAASSLIVPGGGAGPIGGQGGVPGGGIQMP
jgi:hypothetical protein